MGVEVVVAPKNHLHAQAIKTDEGDINRSTVRAVSETKLVGSTAVRDDVNLHPFCPERRNLRVHKGLRRNWVLGKDVGNIAHVPVSDAAASG